MTGKETVTRGRIHGTSGLAANDFSGRLRPGASRLAAAVALSCLLHLAVGTAAVKKPMSLPGGEPVPARTTGLAVRIAPAGDPAAATATHDDRREAERRPAPTHAAPPAPHDDSIVPSLPGRTYYPAEQLTKRPQPTVGIDLEGPELRPVVASGRMVLRLWIDDDGSVADAEVEATELPPAFSRIAVAAFRQTRFIPGELGGRPVGSFVRLEVSYEDHRSRER